MNKLKKFLGTGLVMAAVIVLAFAGLLNVSEKSEAAIAFVNATGNEASASAGTIAAPAFAATAGNLIVVCGGSSTNSATRIQSIADTALNSYSRINGINNIPVGGLEIWYAKNINAHATNIVTITYTGNSAFRLIMTAQYSGIDTSNQVDVSNVGENDGEDGANPITASSVTTNADDVLVGCDALNNNSTHTAGSGYTNRMRANGATPNNPDLTTVDGMLEDRIVSATGSYTAGFTINTASASNLMVFAAFKQASAAGPTTHVKSRGGGSSTAPPVNIRGGGSGGGSVKFR